MRDGFRLGDYDPDRPQNVGSREVEGLAEAPNDDRRLMREAKRRMSKLTARTQKARELSNVERAMLRNAPDLAAPTQVAHEETALDWRSRWPRPRLLALLVLIGLAAAVPTVAMRLMIWLIIMLLLTAVLLGPERARDAVLHVLLHFGDVWEREISLVRRLLTRSGS